MYMFLGSTPESITDGTVLCFDRLVKAYSDPMTEVYLLFYQATLQLFVNFNKFLQREDLKVLAERRSNHSSYCRANDYFPQEAFQ